MAYLPNLSTTNTLEGGWYVVVAKGNSNNAMRASMDTLAEFVQEYIQGQGIETEYSAPSSNGFNVELPDTDENIRLILTPTGTFAAGTITLPDSTVCVDHQQIIVNSTQIVTTLTVSGNGATVTGAPTTLAANAFFTLMFDAVTTTWYRVG